MLRHQNEALCEVRFTDLVLVGGVERDLADLLVLAAELRDASDGQLDALEQRRLGRVAVAFPARQSESVNISTRQPHTRTHTHKRARKEYRQVIPTTGVVHCECVDHTPQKPVIVLT